MRGRFLLLRLLRVRSWRCLGALIAGYEGCFDNEELEAGKMRVFGCDVVGGGVHDRGCRRGCALRGGGVGVAGQR